MSGVSRDSFCFFAFFLDTISDSLDVFFQRRAKMSIWLFDTSQPEAHLSWLAGRDLIFGDELYGVLVIYTCLVRA